MFRTIALASFFVLASFAALADEDVNYAPNCTAPTPPTAVDGNTATQQQIDAARQEVSAFLSASNSYRNCLGRALGGRQDLAFFTKSNVPTAIVRQIEGKVADNQTQKERVGRDFNAAVAAFNARNGHP